MRGRLPIFRAPAALAAAVIACLLCAAAPAPAGASDEGATSSYLRANFTIVHTAAARIHQVEATLRGLQRRLGSECGAVAANSPEDTESEQLSNEVVGTLVLTAIRVDLPAGRAFVKAVRGLRWSNASITHAVQAYAGQVSRMIAMPVPHLCADLRSWAGSGFQTLPAATEPFDRAFLANWVAPGLLPGGLAGFESSSERALARRTAQLENQVTELEAREVLTWGNIMNELDLLP